MAGLEKVPDFASRSFSEGWFQVPLSWQYLAKHILSRKNLSNRN